MGVGTAIWRVDTSPTTVILSRVELLVRIDALTAAWADRLDPMLVRCVRQDLRSKIFVGVFSLLLLLSASAALIFATSAAHATDDGQRYGRYLFIFLAWCWSFALIVVQATATHRLVAQERNDDTWDLVELTGLPPWRLVRGLLLASLTQSALYTAGMAPFLVMAYLLRGLDLLTIVGALITVPLLGVLAAAIALFLACAAPNRKARMAGGGLISLLMLIGWMVTGGIQFSGINDGPARILRALLDGDRDAWLACAVGLNGWAIATWLTLVFATALLTHRADDRSSRVRRAVALAWGNILLWLGVVLLVVPRSGDEQIESIVAVGIVGAALTLLVGFFAMTEDYALTPRQARAITGAHGWRRRVQELVGPGAARGRWYTLAFALCAALLLACGAQADHDVGKAARLGWYTLGYGFAILLLGDAVARVLFGRWCTHPMHRRLVILGLASAWSILPALAALVVGEDGGAGYQILRLLTPGWAIYHYAIEEPGELLAGVLLILPLAMFAFTALQAWRHQSLVTRRVLAEAGDHNPRA